MKRQASFVLSCGKQRFCWPSVLMRRSLEGGQPHKPPCTLRSYQFAEHRNRSQPRNVSTVAPAETDGERVSQHARMLGSDVNALVTIDHLVAEQRCIM